MLGWMPDTGGTQVSRPKLPLSPQWGEVASVSDYNTVWQVPPGPLAKGFTREEGPQLRRTRSEQASWKK